MTEEEQLEALITIGVEARKFIESELGEYVLGCARQEINELIEELKDTQTPLDKTTDLRLEIKTRERAIEWLAEAIQQADNAYSQLEIANSED